MIKHRCSGRIPIRTTASIKQSVLSKARPRRAMRVMMAHVRRADQMSQNQFENAMSKEGLAQAVQAVRDRDSAKSTLGGIAPARAH
jgi:hypothetical protein